MGSTKKHKKHKTRRREKYEEFSNSVNPEKFHWGYKWLNDNSASELDSIAESISPKSKFDGFAAIRNTNATVFNDVTQERHKQCNSSKNRKHRMKSHKRHRERKMQKMANHVKFDNAHCDGSSHVETTEDITLINNQDSQPSGMVTPQSNLNLNESNIINGTIIPITTDDDSSQGSNSFADDDNSQPLPENVLYYAGMTTENSPSCRPVSKPIRPRKLTPAPIVSLHHHHHISANSSPHIQSNINGTPSNILTVSPSTSKSADCAKTSNSSETGREPRTCVLKLKQQKSPLNKLLEHLLRVLEKRDPHQFFAWPVTDDIAPGYSRIISKPMDFSTIRQKIEDNEYSTLTEFTNDFRLMCDNAIKYNHVDTVYHKAAKRLLQVGLKHLAPESLMRSLKPLSGYLRELTVKELGFELLQNATGECSSQLIDSADEGASTGAEETTTQTEEDRTLQLKQHSKFRLRSPHTTNNNSDVNSERNLRECSKTDPITPTATTTANAEYLTRKEKPHKTDFWRLNKDGSTSLNFLIKDENEGPEKVIDLGTLVGKLEKGTGQVHSYREDKRNEAKVVKPLYYGPYSSFAPTYDSRFATLNKEESQLIMHTYGDTDSVEYSLQYPIESESSYATILAKGLLLNVFTNDEQDTHCLEDLNNCTDTETSTSIITSNVDTERAQIESEYEKYKNTRIDFNRLRTLSDLGIDVSFLDDIEKEMEHFELTRRLQEHLSNNYHLIDKLRTMQHERLSQPLPQHLALVPQPSQEETQLANQITQQLRDVAKKLPPSAITDPYSLRKAMGVSYVGLPPIKSQKTCPNLPPLLQKPVTLPILQLNYTASSLCDKANQQQPVKTNVPVSNAASIPMDIDGGDILTTTTSNATTTITASDSDALQHKLPHEINESTDIQTQIDSNAMDNTIQL